MTTRTTEVNGFTFDPPLDDAYELVMAAADGSQRDVAETAEDWLAAADYVGKRDRELLNRLAQ